MKIEITKEKITVEGTEDEIREMKNRMLGAEPYYIPPIQTQPIPYYPQPQPNTPYWPPPGWPTITYCSGNIDLLLHS